MLPRIDTTFSIYQQMRIEVAFVMIGALAAWFVAIASGALSRS
jgi:hypothetical protein